MLHHQLVLPLEPKESFEDQIADWSRRKRKAVQSGVLDLGALPDVDTLHPTARRYIMRTRRERSARVAHEVARHWRRYQPPLGAEVLTWPSFPIGDLDALC